MSIATEVGIYIYIFIMYFIYLYIYNYEQRPIHKCEAEMSSQTALDAERKLYN